MAWKKSPPELIAAFEKAKPTDPAVQQRPMFGYPAFFLNGKMFAGTFQDKIVVKFGDDKTIPGASAAKGFEPMPGRPMTGFFIVPETIAKSPTKLRAWVDHAHEHAKKQPAKKAPTKKPRAS